MEPALGVLADAGRRRLLITGGGIAFAAGAALTAASTGFAGLLAGFILLWPASGAFVSLSQAALMDLEPSRRELNLARWTLAGAAGAVAGPVLIGAALLAGAGWRPAFAATAALTLALAVCSRRIPDPRAADLSPRAALRTLLAAVRRPSVLRWLLLQELTNLMGDVLLGFLALYLVAAGLSVVAAAGAVLLWTLAVLAGDALLLPALERASGSLVLRVSALISLVAFPAFLLVPAVGVKIGLLVPIGLLHAGWYAIPQARLYSELGSASGVAVALSSLSAGPASLLPLGIGLLAGGVGLGSALWLCLLAPVSLLLIGPRTGSRPGTAVGSTGGAAAHRT